MRRLINPKFVHFTLVFFGQIESMVESMVIILAKLHSFVRMNHLRAFTDKQTLKTISTTLNVLSIIVHIPTSWRLGPKAEARVMYMTITVT